MGARLSRFADSINRRRRRSLATVDVGAGAETPNGNIETGHDPAVHGAKLEDRNYNNEAFKKRTVDPGDPQQNDAALKIQTQYRQHSAKEEVKQMREEDAAARIQAGFRGYLDREHVRKMKRNSVAESGVSSEPPMRADDQEEKVSETLTEES